MALKNKINYGIDAPWMGVLTGVLFLILFMISLLFRLTENPLLRGISSIGLSLMPTGVLLIILIILYVKVEKFRQRDRMLDRLTWKGDEQVLDIGTGKGLLMIGAAKRLTTGKSHGIDIWDRSDLSNNSYDAAMQNVNLEI